MNFYLELVFLLFTFAFLDFFKSSLANKVMLINLALVLIYIAGFRYGLETDYWSYWRIFHGLSKTNVEIGYILFSSIIKVFTENFNYFLVCVAILSLGLKCRIFSKMHYPLIALLIFFLRFFLFFELNVIRQGIATAFLLVAVYLLSKKKIFPSIFFICIAATMHISSLVFILAFFVKKIEWNIRKISISIILVVIFRFYILVPLIDSLGFLAGMGGDFLVKGTKYLLQSTVPSLTGMAISVVRIFLPVLCIYCLGVDDDNRLYFNLFILGAFINVAFMGMDTISYRLAMVFYSAEGLAVSESIRQRNLKTVVLIGIIVTLNFISFYNGVSESESAIPYRNYLFVDPNTVKI